MEDAIMEVTGIRFEDTPVIKTRKDAIQLLDIMIKAAFFENAFIALEALKKAIEKKIIYGIKGRQGNTSPEPIARGNEWAMQKPQ